jgi:DNA-cytosine methyltransferase
MKYASLFSGVGGFDLGFDQAGMECVLQVEQDKQALEVLSRHWPNVPKMTDVREVTKESIDVKPDVIVGGFPCQDVSIAGKRKGLAGERSGLWSEFHRILRELTPRWVVIENVPGLFSSNGGRDFAVILRGLEECGYFVAWRVLDSRHFGVAQRRRRVFLVASLGSGRCTEVLFESEGLLGNPPKGEEEGQGATGEPSEGVGSYNGPSQCDRIHGIDGVAQTIADGGGLGAKTGLYQVGGFSAGNSSGSRSIGWTEDGTPPIRGGASGTNQVPTIVQQNQRDEVREMKIAGALPSQPGMKQQNYVYHKPGSDVADTLRSGGTGAKTGLYQVPTIAHENLGGSVTEADHSRALRSGASHSAQFVTYKTDGVDLPHKSEHYAQNGMQYNLVQALLARDYKGVGNQYVAEGKVVPSSGSIRRLTPTECCRLQGFPDDWNDWQSDSARYKQMGNAVTVNVAEWIGQRIMQVQSQTEETPRCTGS